MDHPQAPPAAGKTLTRDSEVSAVVATRVAHGLRWVEPYHHTFETHAKGRWVGREVLEVFAKEFQSEPREAYEHAIEAGRITINGLPVTATTIVRDNDLIRNTAHRHEPPVIATELDIIHEDDSVVAVDKPASMPVHACGRFVPHDATIAIMITITIVIIIIIVSSFMSFYHMSIFVTSSVPA